MNIGINLDSVIANTHSELELRLNQINIYDDIIRWDKYSILENIDIDQNWFNELLEDSLYWANAIPNEDAWNMINKWFYSEHNIFIIADRSARQFDISEWWLNRWLIPYNKFFCGAVRGCKNTYIDMLGLDLFIEDDAYESNILSEKIPTLLLNKNYNINYDCDNVVRVDNCYSIDKLLEKYFNYDS